MDLLEKRVKSRFSHRQIFFTEFQSVGSPMALLRVRLSFVFFAWPVDAEA